jgi:hypothetical protein
VAQWLLDRKFTLLFGHRQSGKTTTCIAILQWFQDNLEYIKESGFGPLEIQMLTFDSTVKTEKGPSMFWKSLCQKLRTIDENRFCYDDKTKESPSTFQNFFSKRNHPSINQVILLVDEASRLSTSDDNECTVDFIDSLRTLKADRHNYCLHSILLVGTASIRDLLISRAKPGAASKISPFSNDNCITCNRFTKDEVESLFKQYATDNDMNFKFIDIAADIFDLTLGHKGLVGACGGYIQNIQLISNNHIQTLDDWKKYTPVQLLKNISVMPTYQSIVRNLGTLSPSCRSVLIKVLRFGMCQIDLVS